MPRRPRKRNRVAHVGKPRHIRERALKAEAEAGVRHRPVAAQVQVPPVRLGVQAHLARVHARTEALKLFNWRIAAELDAGRQLGPAAASATKVYGTELSIEACRLLMEVLGAGAPVRAGSPGEVVAGRIERMQRTALILTFGGGTNEIQRDIIAAAALGLPYRR